MMGNASAMYTMNINKGNVFLWPRASIIILTIGQSEKNLWAARATLVFETQYNIGIKIGISYSKVGFKKTLSRRSCIFFDYLK